MSSDAREVELSVHPDEWLDPTALTRAVARAMNRAPASVGEVVVLRRAVDARRGRVRLALRVRVHDQRQPAATDMPAPVDLPALTGEPRVVIVGAGPAGLFCAHALAAAGVRSVILERGQAIRQRRHDLARLTRAGTLDPESNYCFGEGGAGTFSDGKLYTRARKRGSIEHVLRTLVGYGASPDILVSARPHIGTNKLPQVVTRMREHLASAGVEISFGHRVDGLVVRGQQARGVSLSDGRIIEAQAIVVAPGHSARDVQGWMQDAGARLSFKPFALGVRVEHPQSFIDSLQFGTLAGHPALGAASYRVVEQVGHHGVFSFCMCPGGFIVPATTEVDAQVVNGWSPSSRRGRYANSGLVVDVGEAVLAERGYDPADPLAGVALQRAFEQRAYAAGGGGFVAPAQSLGDFVAGTVSTELPPSSYPRGLCSVDLDDVLGPLAPVLRAALARIERRMPGFVSNEAVAVALESRTSSPVRMERDRETCQATGLAGVYPCAEGAGHAGGIMSAALDGIRVARAIASRLGTSVGATTTGCGQAR